MSMIGQRLQDFRRITAITNGLLTFVLFWLFYAIFFHFRPTTSLGDYIGYSLVLVVVVVLMTFRKEVSRLGLLSQDMAGEMVSSLRLGLSALFALLLYLVATKDLTMSRTFLFSFIPLLMAMLAVSNRLLPKFAAKFCFPRQYRCKTLVLGKLSNAQKIADWIRSHSILGLTMVGVVTREKSADSSYTLPILGRPYQLEHLLAASGASMLIIADHSSEPDLDLRAIHSICEEQGVRLVLPCNVLTGIHSQVSFLEEDGVQWITFRREPLQSPLNRAVKRILDLAISVPVVVFVLPVLCLVVWLMHRAQSPGPLFFSQARIGSGNRPFKILKFRSMHIGTFNESKQAQVGDPRVFPLGQLIRKSSIDEFPQFLNVMLGNMSVVGPRPHLPIHEEHFATISQGYKVRWYIRPGITGLAQVRGHRGEVKGPRCVHFRAYSDLYYIENWSFRLDLYIIWKTFTQVFKAPKTAY
jgi:exopolysaccharide biosynthesis polyprenyl glycosylphosphotransferase